MRTLYPPRPKSRLSNPLIELPQYENNGQWVVQRKFNGTRVVINVNKGKVGILNRHAQTPKQFKLTPEYEREILALNLDPSLEYWLDAELLDAKTKNQNYKGKIVLFDILQAGRYFLGSPNQMERLAILKGICRNPTQKEANLGIALCVSNHIWMAETFETNFVDRFNDFLKFDEIEGLVLRKRKSVIDKLGNTEYDCSWIVRCRKPHKNYAF